MWVSVQWLSVNPITKLKWVSLNQTLLFRFNKVHTCSHQSVFNSSGPDPAEVYPLFSSYDGNRCIITPPQNGKLVHCIDLARSQTLTFHPTFISNHQATVCYTYTVTASNNRKIEWKKSVLTLLDSIFLLDILVTFRIFGKNFDSTCLLTREDDSWPPLTRLWSLQ